MKPPKILYPDQQDVWNQAAKFLISLISKEPCVSQALVWASLAEEKFGLYECPYNNMEGSDIDLVIIVDEKYPIPNLWKFTKVQKSWFDLYHLGKFNYQGHNHLIDGLLVFPSRHNFDNMHRHINGRSRQIYSK